VPVFPSHSHINWLDVLDMRYALTLLPELQIARRRVRLPVSARTGFELVRYSTASPAFRFAECDTAPLKRSTQTISETSRLMKIVCRSPGLLIWFGLQPASSQRVSCQVWRSAVAQTFHRLLMDLATSPHAAIQVTGADYGKACSHLRSLLKLEQQADLSQSSDWQVFRRKLGKYFKSLPLPDRPKKADLDRARNWCQMLQDYTPIANRPGRVVCREKRFSGPGIDLQRWAACRQWANRNASQLQQLKLESMKELAYGASHEVNNPLANIAARSQLLRSSETDPHRQHQLATIEQQAMRAHEMISNLMQFASPRRPHLQPTCLLQTVLNAMTSRLPQAIQSETLIQFNGTVVDQELIKKLMDREPPLVVPHDSTQIEIVVDSLIKNALEAITASGLIKVGVEAQKSAVTVRVLDNGPGMDPGKLPNVFDPFFSGREAGRGLGFGLSRAWRIVHLHGGTISANNLHPQADPPRGFQVEFQLPNCNSGSESR